MAALSERAEREDIRHSGFEQAEGFPDYHGREENEGSIVTVVTGRITHSRMLGQGFEPDCETVAHSVRAATRVVQIPSSAQQSLTSLFAIECSVRDLNPGPRLERPR